MQVTPLAWDSAFFGLRIGKAILSLHDEAEELMQMNSRLKKQYDLVYLFSSQDFAFHSPSFRLVDKRITYRKPLDGTDVYHSSVKEWTSRGTTPDLVSLALESGQFSRFKTDPRFPSGSFERLYTRWIEQSVSHIIATHVFYYDVDSKPRGLVTLDIRGDEGHIGLVAVDKIFQHKHIGSDLMRHVSSFAFQQGVRSLTVPTQSANRPACHFYERIGFSQESAVNVWHWWLQDGDEH